MDILDLAKDYLAKGAAESGAHELIRELVDECQRLRETDIRWAINVLLEKIATKFEANETMDIWRSDASALIRGFKHKLP